MLINGISIYAVAQARELGRGGEEEGRGRERQGKEADTHF